jgi:hypothetical protein
MLTHDSYAQNSTRVCTSILPTFPTANAPFELANAPFELANTPFQTQTSARKCLWVVLARKTLYQLYLEMSLGLQLLIQILNFVHRTVVQNWFLNTILRM